MHEPLGDTLSVGGAATSTDGCCAGSALTVTAGGETITAGGFVVTAGGGTITADGLTITAGGETITDGLTVEHSVVRRRWSKLGDVRRGYVQQPSTRVLLSATR